MKRSQSGFTLVEIAIVLVIIGLLLGGVLKGEELISSAKVKNLAGDFRNIPLFIYGYQDKFRALPGDDAAANVHVTGGIAATTPANTVGNGVLNGNWNSTTTTDETFLLWQHIRLANLTTGATSINAADYRPSNAVGGGLGVQGGTSVAANSPVKDGTGAAMRGTYIICSSGIPGKYAKQLDIQMDDGNTATGAMLSTPASGYAHGVTATATVDVDDTTSYTVCLGV